MTAITGVTSSFFNVGVGIAPIMLIGVVGMGGALVGALSGQYATTCPGPQSPHSGMKAPGIILFEQSTFLWGPPHPKHLMVIMPGG